MLIFECSHLFHGRRTFIVAYVSFHRLLIVNLFQGQLSTKSDVWSFGVVLWEVLTYARSRPLEALNDRQVLANLERIRNSSSSLSSDESSPTPSATLGGGAASDGVIDNGGGDDDDVGSSSGGPIVLPPRPAGCPRETYDLMRECWRCDPDRRPTFRETHMFLQRLNVGYSPPPRLPMTATNGTGLTGDFADHRPSPVSGTMTSTHRGGTASGYQRTSSKTALT
jgi:serine/threonine protein kinase